MDERHITQAHRREQICNDCAQPGPAAALSFSARKIWGDDRASALSLLHAVNRPRAQQPTRAMASAGAARLDRSNCYRPLILRAPSLLSIFAITVLFIGLLQYAAQTLPLKSKGHEVRFSRDDRQTKRQASNGIGNILPTNTTATTSAPHLSMTSRSRGVTSTATSGYIMGTKTSLIT